MNGKNNLYRMNRLMNYKEIEAFSAQKNAGSKSGYFALLDDFTNNAPAIVADLAAPTGGKELDAFLKKIYDLQKMLLAIGASPLLWDAEKTAEEARGGDVLKCTHKTKVFCAKVVSLCERLNEAKIDPTEAAAANAADTTIMVAIATGAAESEQPKARIKPEEFASLCTLIENFEVDAALTVLQSLVTFTYNNAIDSALAAMQNDLTHFDYDGAEAQAKHLLELVNAAEGNADKATRKKILAVDDVPDVLNTVKSVLKNDYTVYGVTNHVAALKFLTTNKADLIVLDIEMPEMDGFELLGVIRKIKAYEKTPVLFLTGSVTVDNIIKSRKAGGNDFLKKPIDAQVLLEKVKKHLE